MVFIRSSLLLCALAHSDAGMQTFLGIKDPVFVYLQTGLSGSGTGFWPVTVIGGWAGGGGAGWATAALPAAAAMMKRMIRTTLPPTARK
jgi:hypothetical protein